MGREENIFEMTQIEDWSLVILSILIIVLGLFIYILLTSLIWTWFKEPTTPEPTTPLTQPEESQADVFSISLPADITELPSYEESRKYPGTTKPPGYWTIFPYKIYYDQPVITVKL